MALFDDLKRLVVEELLSRRDHLLIVVDPRSPGVHLPADLIEAGAPVGLHIGRRLAVPIPDLTLSETELSGTLSFQRTPFACRVPWASLVQVSVDDDHVLWVGAPRKEVQEAPDQADETALATEAPGGAEEHGRRRLRLV